MFEFVLPTPTINLWDQEDLLALIFVFQHPRDK